MEGIVECDHTFIWWWHVGRPKECWYYQPTGAGRIKLTALFGLDQWSTCAFVQFIMTSDDEVDKIRTAEPGGPNIGGADGPDRPPPKAPAADTDMPVPDTPMQTPRESWSDRDESLTGPESDGTSGGSPPTTPSSRRFRSTRRGRSPSAPAPAQRPKRRRQAATAKRRARRPISSAARTSRACSCAPPRSYLARSR